MERQFKIGVIGTGMWGKNHIQMFQEEPRAQIAWAYDILPAAAEAAEQKSGPFKIARDYREILDDPAVDAVIVTSPPYTHSAYGVEILRAGKHLLIEKPMATTPEDAQAVVAEAKQRPGQVALDGSCRHARLNPKFRFVRDLIASGKLGEVYHVHHNMVGQGTYYEYNPNALWSMDKRYAGGGPLLDWGVYDMSFHLGVLGDQPNLHAVHAFTRSGLRDLGPGIPVVDVEMHGAALLEFDGGLTYYYERGSGAHNSVANETRIYGTRGGLRFAYTSWEPNTIEFFSAGSQPCRETLTVDMTGHPKNDNTPFVAHFLDCLEGKAQPMMPVALACKHLEILLQIINAPEKM